MEVNRCVSSSMEVPTPFLARDWSSILDLHLG